MGAQAGQVECAAGSNRGHLSRVVSGRDGAEPCVCTARCGPTDARRGQGHGAGPRPGPGPSVKDCIQPGLYEVLHDQGVVCLTGASAGTSVLMRSSS